MHREHESSALPSSDHKGPRGPFRLLAAVACTFRTPCVRARLGHLASTLAAWAPTSECPFCHCGRVILTPLAGTRVCLVWDMCACVSASGSRCAQPCNDPLNQCLPTPWQTLRAAMKAGCGLEKHAEVRLCGADRLWGGRCAGGLEAKGTQPCRRGRWPEDPIVARLEHLHPQASLACGRACPDCRRVPRLHCRRVEPPSWPSLLRFWKASDPERRGTWTTIVHCVTWERLGSRDATSRATMHTHGGGSQRAHPCLLAAFAHVAHLFMRAHAKAHVLCAVELQSGATQAGNGHPE